MQIHQLYLSQILLRSHWLTQLRLNLGLLTVARFHKTQSNLGTVEITPAQEIAKKHYLGPLVKPRLQLQLQQNQINTLRRRPTRFKHRHHLPRDIAGVENITKDTSGHQIDPAEFGYTEPTKTTATSDYKAASEGYTAQQFVVQEKNALTGADLGL